MQILFYFLLTVFILLNLFFALQFLLPVFLFVAHWFLPNSPQKLLNRYKILSNKNFDFAAIITAHQDTRFIAPLVDSFLKQTYHNFIVYVIADDCNIHGLDFPGAKVILLKPEPSLHAKIKSIKYGVDHFIRQHDALIIFDSDNLLHPEYLNNLNKYFQRGFRVVQANMLSKNIDSPFSRLDSLGHTYHNFLERQIKMEMGFTSSILGLGLAIDMDIYRQVIYKNELGGFDKKLQAQITMATPMVAYAKDVIVFDEKVDDGAAFQKQRTRWIFTYFEYLRDSLIFFKKSLVQLNPGRLLIGFSMLRPPMFLTIGISIILMAACFYFSAPAGMVWVGIFILYIINFILIIATQSQQKGIAGALLYIPAMILRQIKALLKIRQAKKGFLKTNHERIIYIQELLEQV